MSISAIQNIFRNTKAQWDTDYMQPNDTAAANAGKDDEGKNNNDLVRLSLRNNNMHMPRNNEQQ
jgi:hypothetical protein